MASTYHVLEGERHDTFSAAIQELETTLFQSPRCIPSKFHYDAEGSHLFELITKLPEYYPTRCEEQIFLNYSDELANLVEKNHITQLIELGAGDGHKTKELLRALLDRKLPFEYIPIDFSESAVKKLVQSLQLEFEDSPLKVNGIIGEYVDGLTNLEKSNHHNKMILFLGSSIGNFSPEEGHQFLKDIAKFMHRNDKLLLGFDLKKDVHLIEKAYNDAAGVTRDFNLHLLDILNHLLGANFKRDQFQFNSYYNPAKGCVESCLVSKKAQTIELYKFHKELYLQPWEGIHVENSYKYNIEDMEQLLDHTGLKLESLFFDNLGYFAEAIVHKKE